MVKYVLNMCFDMISLNISIHTLSPEPMPDFEKRTPYHLGWIASDETKITLYFTDTPT